MKIRVILAAVALTIGAVPARAFDVGEYADAFTQMIGEEFDDGLVLSRVEVDGNLIVLVIDGPAAWRGETNASDISDGFFEGFCEDSTAFFDGVLSMRIDTTEAGKNRQAGQVVDSCVRRQGD